MAEISIQLSGSTWQYKGDADVNFINFAEQADPATLTFDSATTVVPRILTRGYTVSPSSWPWNTNTTNQVDVQQNGTTVATGYFKVRTADR